MQQYIDIVPIGISQTQLGLSGPKKACQKPGICVKVAARHRLAKLKAVERKCYFCSANLQHDTAHVEQDKTTRFIVIFSAVN